MVLGIESKEIVFSYLLNRYCSFVSSFNFSMGKTLKNTEEIISSFKTITMNLKTIQLCSY